MRQPCLATSRLYLRRFAALCASPAISDLLSNTASLRHMHFRSWTHDQRRQWFDDIVQGEIGSWEWIIGTHHPHAVIGWVGIGVSPDPMAATDISFGYAMMRQYWGRGFMTEALRAVVDHQFAVLQVPRLQATCSTEHPASASVLEKVGMRRWKTDVGADLEGNVSQRHYYVMTQNDFLRQPILEEEARDAFPLPSELDGGR